LPQSELSGFDSHKSVGGAVQSCPLVWIEIELVDEENGPVPGERYRIELSNGSIREGSLDSEGRARCEGIPRGNCNITFPDLDKDAWERI
jgi:hypothetical protein